MASSVLHTNASLTSASAPTATGDWNICGWFRIKPGGYNPAGDTAIFACGTTGGASEGVIIQVAAGTTALAAAVFRAGAAEFPLQNILTGSNSNWVCVSIEHASGSANYKLRWRLEGATTWTSTTLTLTTQIVSLGTFYIGTDQFAEPQPSANSRHFFVQAATMSDAALLTASQNINSAPAGTNLHWLRLLNSGTALTNGGTAGNWTAGIGTLASDTVEPTEAVASPVAATRLAVAIPGKFNRTLPPFWPPSGVGSFQNAAGVGVVSSASCGSLGVALAAVSGLTIQPASPQGQVPPPTVPGVFNRKLPPFWPPSPVGSFQNAAGGSSIVSASCASLGLALAAASGLTIQPSSPVALGLGLLGDLGAAVNASAASSSLGFCVAGASAVGVSPVFTAALGVALAPGSGLGIGAGSPGSIGLALCGAGPACVAPAAPTALGVAYVTELGAGLMPGFACDLGLALVGGVGAAVNGTFAAGFGGTYGIGLLSASGYGIGTGTPASLGQATATASAVLFVPSRPAAIAVALPAASGGSVMPGFAASIAVALPGAAGAAIASGATPGYAAGYGLGLLSGSGYGIAVGAPAALSQALTIGAAVSLAPSSPVTLGMGAAAASGGGIVPSSPRTIALGFAFAGATTIVPGFAAGNGTALGYALVGAQTSSFVQGPSWPVAWPQTARVNYERRVAVAQRNDSMQDGYFAEYTKDPTDVEDYAIDWSKLVGSSGLVLESGETIASSVWTFPNNTDGSLVIVQQGLTSPFTTIAVSGGNIANDYYDLRNHVTTTGGSIARQHTRTIRLYIRNR